MTKLEYRRFEKRILDQKIGSRVMVNASEYRRVMDFYQERGSVITPLNGLETGFDLCGVFVICEAK